METEEITVFLFGDLSDKNGLIAEGSAAAEVVQFSSSDGKKLLKEKNVEQRLYELEDIGEPDPWPSTIDSWWSYLLTAVDAEWMKFGNKLSDVKEPALEASAPVSDVNSVFR